MSDTRTTIISAADALKGRPTPILDIDALQHPVLHQPLALPADSNKGYDCALFAMGCFWGAERLFWKQKGVITTAVVYCGGYTENPTYSEVCTGQTGHAEGVRIIFDRNQISYQELLDLFWNNHNPTQGMRQKNDVGTQYRSVIYYANDEQHQTALQSKEQYQQRLSQAGYDTITTTIEPITTLYYAEEEHQQYLHKHPNGYCSIGGLNLCSNESC